MKTSLIWKRLLIQNKKIATSSEIMDLAETLGKNKQRALYYLQEQEYIIRILRGIFYVKTIEEHEQGTYTKSIYELLASALKKKGVQQWYFGLETALKMNRLTHEYFTIDYVLTDSYRTTKVIHIIDHRFQFYKRSTTMFHKGVIIKNGVRYSDAEKTILDMIYQRYLHSKQPTVFLAPFQEYKKKINVNKLQDYLTLYPPSLQNKLEAVL